MNCYCALTEAGISVERNLIKMKWNNHQWSQYFENKIKPYIWPLQSLSEDSHHLILISNIIYCTWATAHKAYKWYIHNHRLSLYIYKNIITESNSGHLLIIFMHTDSHTDTKWQWDCTKNTGGKVTYYYFSISIIIIRNSLTLVCQYVPKNNTLHVAFLKIFCAGSICRKCKCNK